MRLDVALKERCRESCGIPEAAWKKFANRLVVVHEKLSVLEGLARMGDRKASSGVTTADPIEAFEAVNSLLDPELQCLKLADLSKPLKAAVYLLPDRNSIQEPGA